MMIRLTHTEFLEQLRLQDVCRDDYALVCPICGTVQSFNSLLAAGLARDEASRAIGFSCEGRATDAGHWPKHPSAARRLVRGCDWTLHGLLKVHEIEVIMDDGRLVPHFRPATPPQALKLRAAIRRLNAFV